VKYREKWWSKAGLNIDGEASTLKGELQAIWDR